MSVFWKTILTVALLGVVEAAPVCAQSYDGEPLDVARAREAALRSEQQSPRALIDNGVLQRVRLGYDTDGIEFGAFRVQPRVSVQLAYDDNVFNAPDRQGDAETVIRPSVEIKSDWGRHSLAFSAGSTIERFARLTSNDVVNYDMNLAGRLDFGLGGHLDARAGLDHATEPRGVIGDLFPGGEPVQYDKRELSGGIEQHMPGAFFGADGGYAAYRYDDVRYQGVEYPQAYRNRDETHERGQLALRIAPELALFTELAANQVRYLQQSQISDFSSHGYSAIGGVTFQVPAMLSGEFGIGYLRQSYDRLGLPAVKGLTYDLSVLWNASPLVTITTSANRSIQQTPFPEAPSIIESRLTAKVDYELLRNLLVNGSGTITFDDFGNTYPVDMRTEAAIGLHYLMSRTLSADLKLEWRHQAARSAFLRAYSGAAVSFGLTAQR